MKTAVFILWFHFALLHCGEAQECRDQQEVCECSSTASVCEFRLEIEELQTFTSYRIRESDGELLTRGTRGYTYYIDDSGYLSSESVARTPMRLQNEHCNSDGPNSDPDFDFTISGRRCSRPMFVDGNTYRKYIAVNGMIPGPTLIVTEGQTVKVTVYNKLTSEGITIHWHGMHQRNTPWMDGVGFISQAPITPGGRFDYIFKATPAGTHWYHSHTGAQRTDGLFGALIVKEKNLDQNILGEGQFTDDPSSHTLTLLDWQQEASLDLFVQIHSSLGFYGSGSKAIGDAPTRDIQGSRYSPTNSVDDIDVGPVPYWSGLINGRGRYNITTLSKLSQFDVERGNKYRFRLIGAQSLYAYRFEIYGHKLTVIATDGHIINPQRNVDYIIIHSGERYDFLLNANQPPGNYWIRATTLETDIQESRPHTAEAVLHYSTSSDGQNPTGFPYYRANLFSGQPAVCTQDSPCRALNCPFRQYPSSSFTQCIHLDELTAPSALAQTRRPNIDTNSIFKFFNFGFEGDSETSAINGRNFRLPPTPYQTYPGQYEVDKMVPNRICSDDSSQTCTYVEEIVNQRYVDQQEPTVVMVLSVVGNSFNRDFSHPVHLHGHSFYIVRIEHGSYDTSGSLTTNNQDVECNDDMCTNPRWRNDMPPQGITGELPNTAIRKDTVIVPAGGYVVIAFVADNPGYWFLHCHIEVHQLEGMAVIIREYPEIAEIADNRYINHNTPPDDINRVGDFIWQVSDFNSELNFSPGTMTQMQTPGGGGGSPGTSGEGAAYFTFLIFFLPYIIIAVAI